MDFSKLGQAAAESSDLTKESSFTREIPRAGVALLRLRDYIELGRHESKNSQYKPAAKCMLVFELNHPDHMVEINGEKRPGQITIRTNIGKTSKSGYKKLFNVMNDACGGTKQHFVQMIGEAFLGEIFHNKSADGKTTYANLDKDGAWSLKKPVQVDALAATETPIPVPELDGTPKAFLWEPGDAFTDDQIKEMWDSIYIDGTRTNDKGEEVSKNWIQETIMENLEWEGSVTQALTQEHISLDDEDEPPFETDLPSLDDVL